MGSACMGLLEECQMTVMSFAERVDIWLNVLVNLGQGCYRMRLGRCIVCLLVREIGWRLAIRVYFGDEQRNLGKITKHPLLRILDFRYIEPQSWEIEAFSYLPSFREELEI